MYITEESERSLGVFILVSLIFHALIIFLYPEWKIASGPGMLLAGNGGIVTLIPLEPERSSPQAQVTRKPAEGVVERPKPVEEPKEPVPTPEPEPEVETKVEAEVDKPPVTVEETPEESPKVESATEVATKPEADAGEAPKELEQEDLNVMEPGQDQDTVLTSEHGDEVVVSGGGSIEKPMGGTEVDAPSPEASAPPKPEPPPPPPLPAAGSVVMGGGRIQYPKNAINEGAAGEVELEVYVPKGSTQAGDITIKKSSGVENLDQVARLTIENGWTMEPLLEDYILSVTVVFSGPPRFEVGILYDGIRYAKDGQPGD
ncbi:MAG: hypothetical protein GX316_04010 [Firmicutes bacterium]|nr:hypothetical protein [Bacillota bacterium]